MIDTTTQKEVIVYTEGDSGPYIFVDNQQLEEITTLLKTNKITFWVDEDVISINGKPAVAVINLGRNADASAVQHILNTNCNS